MRKSELLKALRHEILKHNLGTFVSHEDKIVQTGCAHCKKQFGTSQQLLMLNRLSSEKSEHEHA